ncbi:MAG: hypothetical protein NDI94_06775 [Candidatus Woesearchaeota archaeon]|nr:hypothetical protein [Candidatus Woesearchaeota archaeon]
MITAHLELKMTATRRPLQALLYSEETIFFWLDINKTGRYGEVVLEEVKKSDEIRQESTDAVLYESIPVYDNLLQPIHFASPSKEINLEQVLINTLPTLIGVHRDICDGLEEYNGYVYLDMSTKNIVFSGIPIENNTFKEISFLRNQNTVNIETKKTQPLEPMGYFSQSDAIDTILKLPNNLMLNIYASHRNAISWKLNEYGPIIIHKNHEGSKKGDPREWTYKFNPFLRFTHSMAPQVDFADTIFVHYSARKNKPDEIQIRAEKEMSLIEIYLPPGEKMIVQSNTLIGFQPGLSRLPVPWDKALEVVIAGDPMFNFSKVWYKEGGTIYLSARVNTDKVFVMDEENPMQRIDARDSIAYTPSQVKKGISFRILQFERMTEEVYSHRPGRPPGILLCGEYR